MFKKYLKLLTMLLNTLCALGFGLYGAFLLLVYGLSKSEDFHSGVMGCLLLGLSHLYEMNNKG